MARRSSVILGQLQLRSTPGNGPALMASLRCQISPVGSTTHQHLMFPKMDQQFLAHAMSTTSTTHGHVYGVHLRISLLRQYLVQAQETKSLTTVLRRLDSEVN